MVERVGLRSDAVLRADLQNRGVEVVEAVRHDLRNDFTRETADVDALADHHAATGLAHRREDRL